MATNLPQPLSSAGLGRRLAPFAGAALAGLLTGPLPPGRITDLAVFEAAVVLTALIAVAVVCVPWKRLPRSAQTAVPLAYILVVVLVRQAEGGGSSGAAILLLLPVFWLALYGTRTELALSVVAATMALVAPILVFGDPLYPAGEWRRAILWTVVAPVVGVTVQGLVSEVRRRSAEVGRERARLGAILENLADGVIACDADGTVTLVNQAARNLHSLPDGDRALEDWDGSLGISRPGDGTDLPPEELPLTRALRGETIRGEELLVDDRDGRRHSVLASAQAIHDADDYTAGAVMVTHDITERKEAERLKDEFFALVSHELRTPLTSILGYVEILREEEVEDERASMLAVVDNNARRLERLVGDLLFIAQLEAGNLPLEHRTINIVDVAQAAVDTLRHRAVRGSVSLELESEPVPDLPGDADRIAQVFENLISNAIKYTPEKGRVTVRVFTDSAGLAVAEVEDTGIGIAAEEQDRVYERFFRASTATDRVIEGVGLGLSVVKAIVDGHGGALSLRSEEGVGTCFRVELPLPVGEIRSFEEREAMLS